MKKLINFRILATSLLCYAAILCYASGGGGGPKPFVDGNFIFLQMGSGGHLVTNGNGGHLILNEEEEFHYGDGSSEHFTLNSGGGYFYDAGNGGHPIVITRSGGGH